MAKVKRMNQIKTILSCYLRTNNFKQTARILGVSKNTIKTYVNKCKRVEPDLNELLNRSDKELAELFYDNHKSSLDLKRLEDFNVRFPYWVKELRRVGVTRQLLWREYRIAYPEGYGYSQFCEHFKRIAGRRDLTMSLKHAPGEVMQVDFAGKKLSYIDRQTGEVIDCEVLVAVFPHSQKTFAIALPSQKINDFVHGLNQSLYFFGGLPQIILSDNLRSYVTRADRYEPKFTDLCNQLASHYEVQLKATRVRKPKDKASVENMVTTVYKRVYAPIRNEIFYSIEDLNSRIQEQLAIHNNESFQKKDGNRSEIYSNFERPLMRDLPHDLFEVKKIIKAKVRVDYHVEIGEDRHFYSVPYQYCGKQARVIYTQQTVEVYIDNQRVVIHSRLKDKNKYRRVTCKEHMPKNHQEWLKAKGRKPSYFISIAEQVGPSTHWVINKILRSGIHPAQTFSSCEGVLQLRNKYSNERLENACHRCQLNDYASYTKIKNILKRNLDQVAQQSDLFNSIDHENIRGPQAYS